MDTAFANDGRSPHCPIVLLSGRADDRVENTNLIFRFQQPETVLPLLREHDPAATDRAEAQLRHDGGGRSQGSGDARHSNVRSETLLKSQLPIESLRPPELHRRWRAQTPKLELSLIQARQQERGTPEHAVLATAPRESVAIADSGTDCRSISNLRQQELVATSTYLELTMKLLCSRRSKDRRRAIPF